MNKWKIVTASVVLLLLAGAAYAVHSFNTIDLLQKAHGG